MTSQPSPAKTPNAFAEAIVQAHADPAGQRLWQALIERDASPGELSLRTGMAVADVVKRLETLCSFGVVEPATAEAEPAAQVYRAIARPMLDNEQFARLPIPTRRRIFGEVLADLVTHVDEARDRGGFDRADTHVSWTPLELDERGYHEVVATMDATLNRVLEIQAGVVERRAESATDGPQLRTEVGLLHFGRPETGSSDHAVCGAPGALETFRDVVEDLSDLIADPDPDWPDWRRKAAKLRSLADWLERSGASAPNG